MRDRGVSKGKMRWIRNNILFHKCSGVLCSAHSDLGNWPFTRSRGWFSSRATLENVKHLLKKICSYVASDPSAVTRRNGRCDEYLSTFLLVSEGTYFYLFVVNELKKVMNEFGNKLSPK